MWPSVAWSHRQLNTQAVRVSFDRTVTELVVSWTISRPDVNRSWRRRTCHDDGSCGRTCVARAGKAAEQSAERSVSLSST